MDTSKQLLTALEKSDWLDRVVIFAALLFFILVVLFILKQRVFDRGMRIAFWWTRFIPDFSGDAQLLNMEKGSATVLSTLTSSLVASSAASAVSVLASSSTMIDSTQFPEYTPDVPVVSDVNSDAASIPEQTVHVEL
jgi:protein transport protein SEC20